MDRYQIFPMRYAATGMYEVREYLRLDTYRVRATYLTIAEARARRDYLLGVGYAAVA